MRLGGWWKRQPAQSHLHLLVWCQLPGDVLSVGLQDRSLVLGLQQSLDSHGSLLSVCALGFPSYLGHRGGTCLEAQQRSCSVICIWI